MNSKAKPLRHQRVTSWGIGLALPLLIAAGVTACGDSDEKEGRATSAATTTAVRDSTTSAAPRASATTTATTTATSKPPTSTTRAETAPRVETVELTADPTPEINRAQSNAVRSARDYLDYTAFSRSGLIEQLEYEGYSTADATFAVDQISPDWNEQAALAAENYLDYTAFSRQGLIEQLEFEGFDRAQATYGVDQAGL